MTNDRITKACEIIEYAIKNHTSAKKASIFYGYGKNYVSDVLRTIAIIPNNGLTKKDIEFLELYDKYRDIKNTKLVAISDTYTRIPLETILKLSDKQTNTSPINIKVSEQPNKYSVTPPSNKNKITVEDNGNEKNIEWNGSSYSSDHIKTVDELLEQTKVDIRIWKVKNYIVNKWDVTLINKSTGNPQTIQNYQVKATLEKNILEENNISASEAFQEMLSNYNPPVFKYTQQEINTNENNLLEINIPDLHFGKLAHADETGENYDIKIAGARFIKAVNGLLQRASAFSYNRILFPVGNDFFNVDNKEGTTSSGTAQDSDSRWAKSYTKGVNLLVDAINILKQAGVPVDVMVISGNHDVERSYYMGEFLRAWFNNDEQVTVNNGASPRKYYKFGKVLLGFTHGSEEKEASLPMIMASDIDSKAVWSETVFHEWHLGHQHRKKGYNYNVKKDTIYNEELGVIVRYISSLSSSDFWHHKSGYIGSIKAGEAFIWNDEVGMQAHLNMNIIN